MWKERAKNTNRRGTLARWKKKEKKELHQHIFGSRTSPLARLDSAMVAANSLSALPTNYSDTCNLLNKNLLKKALNLFLKTPSTVAKTASEDRFKLTQKHSKLSTMCHDVREIFSLAKMPGFIRKQFGNRICKRNCDKCACFGRTVVDDEESSKTTPFSSEGGSEGWMDGWMMFLSG